MKRSILLPVSMLAFLVLFVIHNTVMTNANYAVGLPGDTFVNLTVLDGAYTSFRQRIYNVTGTLEQLANGEGVTTYNIITHVGTNGEWFNYGNYCVKYTYSLPINFSILNISNMYDIRIEVGERTLVLTDTSCSGWSNFPTKIIFEINVTNATLWTTPFIQPLMLINSNVTANFTNFTLNVMNGPLHPLVSGTFQLYNMSINSPSLVPRLDEAEINYYRDDQSINVKPALFLAYWHNGDGVYIANATNNTIAENIFEPSIQTVFFPEYYRDMWIDIYWAGTSRPRTYSFAELLENKVLSYPDPVVLMLITIDRPANITVTSIANGQVVHKSVQPSTLYVLPVQPDVMYTLTAVDSNGVEKSIGFTGQSATTINVYFGDNPVGPITYTWGNLNQTYTPIRNLTLPDGDPPSLEWLIVDTVIPVLVAYMVTVLGLLVFPRYLAWLGASMSVGIIMIMVDKGVVQLPSTYIPVLLLLPVAIMLLGGRRG